MIKQIPANKLINILAKELEKVKEIQPPEWAAFVKTGMCKERPPAQKDWWYVRSAAILRRLALGQAVGVSRLRRVYGSRKRRGHKPEHKYPASGNIIRKILQQLETAGFVKTEKGKGRMITAKGKIFVKNTAKSLTGS